MQVTFAGATVSVLGSDKGSFTDDLTLPFSSQVRSILRVYAYGTTSHSLNTSNMQLRYAVQRGYRVHAAGPRGKHLEVEPISVIAAATAVTLSVSPATFTPGATIQASGSGFAVNEEINIFLAHSASAVATTTDGAGRFSAVSLPVPGSLHGRTASLIAFGLTSKLLASSMVTASVATATVPQGHVGGIQIDHYVIGPGGLEIVNCSGFAAGEQVDVRLHYRLPCTVNPRPVRHEQGNSRPRPHRRQRTGQRVIPYTLWLPLGLLHRPMRLQVAVRVTSQEGVVLSRTLQVAVHG